MKTTRPGFLALLFLPLACSGAIITNGGFETGTFSGWSGNTTMTYVTVCKDGDQFYVSGLTCTSHSGTYAAGLGNSSANGTLYQNVATTIGATYNLTYFLRVDNYSQTANNLFQVSWGGATIYSATNLADAGYLQVTFLGLKATTASTRLQFTFKNVPGAFFLDDVSVVLTSEPATMLVAGCGLIALGLFAGKLRPAVARADQPTIDSSVR
jgi:hypothetical protein